MQVASYCRSQQVNPPEWESRSDGFTIKRVGAIMLEFANVQTGIVPPITVSACSLFQFA